MLSSAVVGAENCSKNRVRRQAVEHSGDLHAKHAPSNNLADPIAMKSNSSLRSTAGIAGKNLCSASCHALGSCSIQPWCYFAS